MTETTWLACAAPDEMLGHLGGQRWLPLRRSTADRKLRLFACACCRRIAPLLRDPRSRAALRAGEGYAGGTVSRGELKRARVEAWEAALVQGPAGWAVAAALEGGQAAAGAAGWAALASGDCAAERLAQCALLRELFGNPFRPARLDPDWLAWHGGLVPRLARLIDEEAAFDLLPVLADALEEAGCTDPHVLAHCRGPGPHARGCWALDLARGRS